MASVHDPESSSKLPSHTRAKSSIFKSFTHRRQPSTTAEAPSNLQSSDSHKREEDAMGLGAFAKNNPGALGELQHNQQESAPRSPRKTREEHHRQADPRGRSKSPVKQSQDKLAAERVKRNASKSRDAPSSKPKKTKSGTNLAGLLSRPKSLKNLYAKAVEDEATTSKDKENKEPAGDPWQPPPPIFAQFTSDASARDRVASAPSLEKSRPAAKARPQSFQVGPSSRNASMDVQRPFLGAANGDSTSSNPGASSDRSRTRNIFSSQRHHNRSKSATTAPIAGSAASQNPTLDAKDIEKHLEAMLDRRNIPENQRYKMRNLADTIKAELIRQDWAEMKAAQNSRQGSASSVNSIQDSSAVADGSDCDGGRQKQRSRGKSFTFSRGKKDNASPVKKPKIEGTLGRHFRSKSAESLVPQQPSSSGLSAGSNLFAKFKPQQGPSDYVSYLRKVQKPEVVEVGKLHKLRQLLRNETVAWIEEFIQQGGMAEVVGLLKRIMEIEWREEHEDALLHENLLCLKALSTTARGMQYLHTIQGDLFPKLIAMLFDPERKGPSEFTTRNIITSVLFNYIASAQPAERVVRAKSVLGHLRNQEAKEQERPPTFVLDMRTDRPFTIWGKEIVNVTKEVFWIFLHNLNVVALSKDDADSSAWAPSKDPGQFAYMQRHFPQERPPVPAAPYVGGVEWDATNYIASHLDLLNAILACTVTTADRNKLRADFRISGWERCLGGSLRLCKEKFYGSVHDALRTWVAAANEDGWDVKSVRYGPPPDAQSSPRKSPKKKAEPAPKIEMPKLDFGLDKQPAQRDTWL